MWDTPQQILRFNHQSGIPRHVLYFDTETKSKNFGSYDVQRMILGWTCSCRYMENGELESEVWKCWRYGSDLWAYVNKHLQPKTSLYIFAHNAFFDLQSSGFFKWFAQWGWLLQFFYERGMTYLLLASQNHRTVKVISSTNFYEVSLKRMGDLVGIPKTDIDLSNASLSEISNYCKNDVRILKAGMEKWFRFLLNHDLGKFSLTKASQAMHAYRHRFMKEKITVHANEEIQKLEREAYIGGRCEAFQLGKISDGPFLSLDVNSMYPFVMKTHPVPVRLVHYEPEFSVKGLEYAVKKFAIVARCEVNSDRPIYAVRHGNKIVFPVGRFQCVLNTGSIKEALRRGHLSRVYETAFYEKAIIFNHYVNYFYRLKRKFKKLGMKTEEHLVKVILNSQYGKWAQLMPIVEEEVEYAYEGYYREEILDLVTGQRETVYKMLNKRVTTYGQRPAKNSFTAISGHITDYSRMYLWELIEPLWPDKILYVDTDSLKLRSSDRGLITAPISDNKLGSLKIESEVNSLEIFGPKAYAADGKRVIKGIPNKAHEVGPLTYSYTGFLKQYTHLRKRLDYGVITHNVTKVLKTEYDKGTVLPTGKVVPFLFGSPSQAD